MSLQTRREDSCPFYLDCPVEPIDTCIIEKLCKRNYLDCRIYKNITEIIDLNLKEPELKLEC